MSQLFRSFRKRQKVWLAILGVMLMIAFAFASVSSYNFRDNTATQDPVVVSTKYGEISESEIKRMQQVRGNINQFLARLMQLTAVGIKEQKLLPNLDDQQVMRLLERQLQELGMLRPVSESSVIDQLLIQQKAAELGVVVSDKTINQFLRRVTMDVVTDDQMRELLRSMNLTQGRLFDGLRGQLAAGFMETLINDPIDSLPPAQRWELFRRLRQTATAEVLPVKVEDFMGQVPEPTTAELQALFEEYKDKPAHPGSPDPGFYQQVTAQFQYAKADFETLMKVAEASVTEAEIAEFYEKNKQLIPYTDADPPVEEEEKSEAKPTTDEPTTESPAGDDAADENKPSETPPAEGTPDEEPATPPASESDTNATEPDAQPAGAEPAADEPSQQPQASLRTTPASAAEETLHGHAGDDLLLAQADTAADPRVTSIGDSGPLLGGTAHGDAIATPAPLTFDEQMDALAEQWSLPTDLRGGPRPEFEPLWKVEKRIRQQLAFQRVFKESETQFTQLRDQMTAFYDEHYEEFQKFNEALRDGTELPKPPKFDMEAAVKAFPGLTAHLSPLLTAEEMQFQTDIGKSAVEQQPFRTFAYQSLRPFFVRQSQDSLGNLYLFWKVNETKEYIPTFEQAREKVLHAWKLREARKLALARAEELANRARTEKKSLKETFAGDAGLEVTNTGPFSWLTYGSVPAGMSPNQPPRISQVQGVESAGADFMRTVFQLEPSEIGVALNYPESIAYVVQLETSSPSETVLRETFMVENFSRYSMAAQFDRQELFQAWAKQLTDEAGLDWERMAR